ncbi:MAG: VIT1/CCC1 transporter family protein [Candidatus Marinimicrobia bacterium]|nr:VIT1/CCC1 transporter family protein [Candidatus Neomarinimicrobiota bacterium]MCF7828196.1 VIT1/CCC1 transporter family protein [Candidatus Neomarinimicrobiota bacterium]MCF7879629.1 VIT1/CCC1 transporter family protein [Candidatus Neomarinimicrobiota bacterium]
MSVAGIQAQILSAQKAEITEYYIYNRLADMTGDPENARVLRRIAEEELSHYNFWKERTSKEVSPSKFKIWFYSLVARLFGLTFGIRLMENGEDLAQDTYHDIATVIPDVAQIEADEHEHEEQLIDMLDEESLQYASSIVLGLNDALVELTGAIAGLTLALQNTGLVAVASLVTGISASLSMAGSEYLSTKTADDKTKNPVKASVYTGIAYSLATVLLVIPYFILSNHFWALGWTLLNAILIIFVFTYYISVAKSYSFKRRFWEMVFISMGVAGISFIIGLVIRHFLGVEV